MLAVEDVTVRFGEAAALDGVTLDVGDGEVVTVLGPSGSGKSTLLRVIAGLQRPDSGRVLLDGEDLAPIPPHRRGIGLVFQDHALFHHRDVRGNVAFGLRMRGDPSDAIDRACGELLDPRRARRLRAPLRRHALGRGAAARRARARARARAARPPPRRAARLARPPSARRLLEELERIFDELGVTALYVTHDQAEAFALGDRVAVMRAGASCRSGPPDELWARPADEDVARFLGLANVDGGRVVRPEAVALSRVARRRDRRRRRRVGRAPGPTVRVVVRLDDGRELEAAVARSSIPARRPRRRRDRPGRHRTARVIRRRVIVHGFVQGVFFRTPCDGRRTARRRRAGPATTATARSRRSSKGEPEPSSGWSTLSRKGRAAPASTATRRRTRSPRA